MDFGLLVLVMSLIVAVAVVASIAITHALLLVLLT
jgi:hypothetical protein